VSEIVTRGELPLPHAYSRNHRLVQLSVLTLSSEPRGDLIVQPTLTPATGFLATRRRAGGMVTCFSFEASRLTDGISCTSGRVEKFEPLSDKFICARSYHSDEGATYPPTLDAAFLLFGCCFRLAGHQHNEGTTTTSRNPVLLQASECIMTDAASCLTATVILSDILRVSFAFTLNVVNCVTFEGVFHARVKGPLNRSLG
jgi:hypothetical protein